MKYLDEYRDIELTRPLEEGFLLEELEQVIISISKACDEAGVPIVTASQLL